MEQLADVIQQQYEAEEICRGMSFSSGWYWAEDLGETKTGMKRLRIYTIFG